MSIEVFSDFVCPWCYMGHRRLLQALAKPVERPAVRWRSFQLAPDDSVAASKTAAEAMLGWYPSPEVAEARMATIVEEGQRLGLTLRLDKSRPVNTFDAHRLSHLAAEHGLVDEVHERIFAAYHTDGRNIADSAELVAIGASAGLAAKHVGRMLESDRFVAEVAADRDRAISLGIRGVPRIMIDGGTQISPNQGDLVRLL